MWRRVGWGPAYEKWKRQTRFARLASRRSLDGLGERQHFDRSAHFLTRFNGGFGRTMDAKRQRHFASPPAEKTHPILGPPQHPAADQGLDVDGIVDVERPAINRRLNAVEVHHIEVKGEDVIEAALRQPAMQRHLAALEALNAHACSRGLALAAATAGLALSGPDAATDP